MSDWLTDLRAVLRSWRRSPALSLTMVVTLALGLGLASAIFSFADGYLFRPLPFPDADRNYFVRDPNARIASALKATDTAALRQSAIAELGFVQWGVGHQLTGSEIVVGDRRVEFFANEVTPGFRRTVNLPLAIGRDFTDADHGQQDPVPAWLLHRFWMRELGGAPDVLGRTYVVPGRVDRRIVVVGILAPSVSSFDLNNRPPDALVPALVDATVAPNPNQLSFPIVRLPVGMSAEQGATLIANTLQQIAPASDGRPRAVRLNPLVGVQTRGGQPTARLLIAGAGLILVLVTINLIHLLLTRAVARGGEIATRAALGASRWRLSRLFLVESLLVAAVGIGLGLIVGHWLSSLIDARIPQWPTAGRNMALVPMAFDGRVVAVAALVGLMVAGIGGWWPAWRATRASLHRSSRGAAGVASSLSARTSVAILTSEVAVATVVMVGALFVGAGIWQFLHQPLGFDFVDRWSVTVSTTSPARPSAADFESFAAAVSRVPGVRATGQRSIARADRVEVAGRELTPNQIAAVGLTPGYAEVWNLRLRHGRGLTADEFASDAPVAIVDEKFAALAWPDAEAVGQSVRVGTTIRTVVGVIEPKRESLLIEGRGLAYVPSRQPPGGLWLIAWAPETTADDLRARLRAALGDLHPDADVRVEAITFDDLYLREVGEARFQSPIVAAFGVLTLALIAVGVFGLVSFLVAQRTREFGIRLALGARPWDIGVRVVGRILAPGLVGIAIGVAGAYLLESIVRATLFGWQASSGRASLGAAVALMLIVIAAAMLPARSAMRVDPSRALRSE